MSVAISVLTGGRPVRFGQVHFVVTRRWCHRSTVPGVTSRCARGLLGRCRISVQDGPVGPVRAERRLGAAQHGDLTAAL